VLPVTVVSGALQPEPASGSASHAPAAARAGRPHWRWGPIMMMMTRIVPPLSDCSLIPGSPAARARPAGLTRGLRVGATLAAGPGQPERTRASRPRCPAAAAAGTAAAGHPPSPGAWAGPAGPPGGPNGAIQGRVGLQVDPVTVTVTAVP
jgi:hypothetical protein